MSTQTPELNTARVNKNVGNDTAIESNDESDNNKEVEAEQVDITVLVEDT